MSGPAPKASLANALPIPRSQRTWGGWIAAAVAATAGVASWSFVVGGYTAYYVGAREGTATMLAGALFGQFLVSLSQLPAVTKYGIETLNTTKPQLGVRGAVFSLIVQYATLIGWNLVLLIFLGRAMASVLAAVGLITDAAMPQAATICSLVALVLIWLALQRGTAAVRILGAILAVVILVLGLVMYGFLFSHYTIAEIAAAPPIAPLPEGRLMNYMMGFELLLVSTLSWWAYMGAMFRMVDGVSKSVIPSMGSLGFGWAAAGLIGLYAALVAGEADPTIWMRQLGGPVGGIIVLLFVACANVGSITVGVHAAALGFGQLSPRTQRLGWNPLLLSALIPMAAVLVAFPAPFYDNVGIFLAIIGVTLAPMIGIQIADFFILRRIDTMHLPSLYRYDARSRYWYVRGYCPAGIIALLAGSLTYIAVLDPLTFVPNTGLFQYTGATIPAALIGAVVYLIGMRLTAARRSGAEGPGDTGEG